MLSTILNTVKDAFFSWLWLFGAPIKDINILWIIIPIWVSWFFTEFFQEKKGTGFGNAITNGAVCIWVSVDWLRYITKGLTDNTISTNYTLYIKFAISGLIFIFGIMVIIKGLQRKKFASFGGRIRVITYILVMFTPIIYETASIAAMNIVPIFVFFPLYYLFLELVVFVVPDSKALAEDEGKVEKKHEPDFEKDIHKEESPFKADFNTVSGTPKGDNPFDSSQNFPNSEIQSNEMPHSNSENPFVGQPSPGPVANNSNHDENPFQKEDMPLQTKSYEPQHNDENPFQSVQENDQEQSLNREAAIQNQRNYDVEQEPPQEYKEPNFDQLPNNDTDIWEKIKRKNGL